MKANHKKEMIVKLGDNSVYIDAWKQDGVNRESERKAGFVFESIDGKWQGFLSLESFINGERHVNDLFVLQEKDADALNKFLYHTTERQALQSHGLRVLVEGN